MNIRLSSRQLLLLTLCAICVTSASSGEAQKAVPPGPINLEGPGPAQARTGPIYMLSLVKVADAKPIEYIWLLQKEIVQPNQPVEVQETAYKSLSAPSLRNFVSQLPKGADILCTTEYLPGPDPTMRIGISSYPSFNDFADFCRSKGIRFGFGIPF